MCRIRRRKYRKGDTGDETHVKLNVKSPKKKTRKTILRRSFIFFNDFVNDRHMPRSVGGVWKGLFGIHNVGILTTRKLLRTFLLLRYIPYGDILIYFRCFRTYRSAYMYLTGTTERPGGVHAGSKWWRDSSTFRSEKPNDEYDKTFVPYRGDNNNAQFSISTIVREWKGCAIVVRLRARFTFPGLRLRAMRE